MVLVALVPAPAGPAAAAVPDPVIGTYVGGRIDDRADRVAHQPFGVTAARGFGTFVADPVHHVVRLLAEGEEAVYAGNGSVGTGGDGGSPTDAQLAGPYAVAVDAVTSDVYIADTYGHEVRRVSGNFGAGSPVISTVAGTGAFGFAGDRGSAAKAQLNSPYGLALWRKPAPDGASPNPDSPAILYVADTLNNRIRAVYLAGTRVNGSIATVVGTGLAADGGDGGPAIKASLDQPRGLAVDGRGRLLIADTFNHRLRRFEPTFDPVTGAISGGLVVTVAGSGSAGYTGDGGAAQAARLNLPAGVATSPSGATYIADTANNVIRQVDGAGTIRTFAGNGTAGSGGDGGPAASAQLDAPFGVSVDVVFERDGSHEVVQVADTGNNAVRQVSSGAAGAIDIRRIAGTGTPGLAGPPNDLALDTPTAVVSLAGADGQETRYVLDTFNHAIRVVNPGRAIVSAPLLGDGRPGPAADASLKEATHLSAPMGLAVDAGRRRIFVADTFNNVIREVDLGAATVATVAGTGTSGFGGDGGPATRAQLSFPTGLAVDGDGNLLIADTYNSRVRRLDAAAAPDGTRHISTVAGSGLLGSDGDSGPAAGAQLYFPYGVAPDPDGNLYIADSFNDRVRRVDAVTGTIATVAGSAPPGGLDRPWGLSFGVLPGGLQAAGRPAARRPGGATGTSDGTATGGGTGTNDGTGGGVQGRPALLVADYLHHAVRSLDVQTGVLATVAGNGTGAFAGDGGNPAAAMLDAPRGVTFVPLGDFSEILVADSFSDRVRLIGEPLFTASGGDAGDVRVGTAATIEVRLANAGTGVLAVRSDAIVGGASDFRITSSCAGAVLVHGGSCVVAIQVVPTAEGRRTDTLRIVEAGSGRTHDVLLSANGTVSRIAVNPTSIAFGERPLNTTTGPVAVALSSTGTAPLNVTSVVVAGDGFHLVTASSNPCPPGAFTLPARAAGCNLAVTFTPATTGSKTGSLAISSDAANGPIAVPLSGVGRAVGGIDIRKGATFCPPPSLGGFGCVDPSVIDQSVGLAAQPGGSETDPFRLISTGPGPLTVSGVSVEGDDQFTVAPTSLADACHLPPPSLTLPAAPHSGFFCTFQVTFTNRRGSGAATLVIRHSAGESRVHLSGSTPPPIK